MLTRNIAKSGEVLNWAGFSPFQLHLGLLVNRSQSASCHIAIRCATLCGQRSAFGSEKITKKNEDECNKQENNTRN